MTEDWDEDISGEEDARERDVTGGRDGSRQSTAGAPEEEEDRGSSREGRYAGEEADGTGVKEESRKERQEGKQGGTPVRAGNTAKQKPGSTGKKAGQSRTDGQRKTEKGKSRKKTGSAAGNRGDGRRGADAAGEADAGAGKRKAGSRAGNSGEKPVTMGEWYLTFMYMGIPVLGWIYMAVVAAFGKTDVKKKFARAFLLYKLTFLVVTLILLAAAIKVMIPYAEALLEYIEKL